MIKSKIKSEIFNIYFKLDHKEHCIEQVLEVETRQKIVDLYLTIICLYSIKSSSLRY